VIAARVGLVHRAERETTQLMAWLPAIRALADSEKEAPGFLPEAAYREAIEKRRLVAMFLGYCAAMPNWLTDARLLALAIIVATIVAVWMFRYETTGAGGHRNRITGAYCHVSQECWW
jgi:Flp pilus assembly protein TadB